jgi:quercetin dioxygenase-like cupin family protein
MQAAQGGEERKVRTAITQNLPALDGRRLKAILVEVNSPPHSHPCPVIAYVASGEIRTQVRGTAEVTYKAGGTFYETRNGAHLVSANASQTEPAKLLAFFLCDHDGELSTPVTVSGPDQAKPAPKKGSSGKGEKSG